MSLIENAELRQAPEPTLVDNLLGPHEWGYRDPAEGGFVEDNAPYRAGERIRELEQALNLALCMLERHEPGDSRAISNEFVALACVDANKGDEASNAVIEAALKHFKVGDGIMRNVPEEVRQEPICDYDPVSPDWPGKVCQNYGQANNLELAQKVMNLIAPHWDKTVRNTCADSVRYLFGRELTRFWCDIVDFHHKFRLTYDGPPRALPEELGDFRGLFIVEEVEEYLGLPKGVLVAAAKELLALHPRPADSLERRADQLDALVDAAYVILGTAYLHGFNFAEAWRRVQRANMAKVRAERATDSKRGSTFDVVKPPGWTPPNHLDLVGTIQVIVEEEPVVQHDLF